MRSAADIRAERLRASLTESCCDSCGTMSKKTGKKVCCADEKQEKQEKAAAPTQVDDGQEIEVHVEAKEKPTTHPFIKRCVAAITKNDEEPDRAAVSRAFAICTAQKDRSPKAAKEKRREGVPKQRMADYERALSSARGDD